MSQQLICLVESDSAISESLEMLFEQRGLRVRCHATAAEFLNDPAHDACACFVFDHENGELSGLELLEVLRSRQVTTPAIILTTQGSPRFAHRAARAGAIVLHKPLQAGELLGALRSAAPAAIFN